MSKVTLSAFGDETAANLDEQMIALNSCGVKHIELRGVWGKNVVSLSDQEVERIRTEMAREGFKVSSIGSPIGKISVSDDWDKHLIDYSRIIEIAQRLEVKYIRLFSFYIPEGGKPEEFRDLVIERMAKFAELAGAAGLMAVHENESGIYGDTPERCVDILKSVNSPHLRAVFDPANFVQCSVRPYERAYPLLKDYIEYMHIKDAMLDTGKVVPAGEGDGDVREILADLAKNGYANYLTLEPHLSVAGKFAGFTGPELFKTAASALKSILDDLAIEYV